MNGPTRCPVHDRKLIYVDTVDVYSCPTPGCHFDAWWSEDDSAWVTTEGAGA